MSVMSVILRAVCVAVFMGRAGSLRVARTEPAAGAEVDHAPAAAAAVQVRYAPAAADGTEEVEASENPTEYTMDDAIRLLWYGYDIGHELQGILARAPRTRYYVKKLRVDNFSVKPASGSPKLIILGPKDSGVSLLMELLELNYWQEMQKACDWDHLRIDHDRPWKGHLFCRLWSRGLQLSDPPAGVHVAEGAESLYEVLSRQGTDPAETVVLFMVKSPLATLMSWNTAIRERTACMKRPAHEWGTPCMAEDMAWMEAGNRDRAHAFEVSSTMDLYNRYLKMYHEIKKDGKFRNSMFVTYEDLVEDPADVVLSIAGAMNWKPLGDIEVQESLSSGGFPAAGRPLLVEELHSRTWLGWAPEETRTVWCQGLNFTLFRDIAENTFRLDEFPHVTYGLDCQ